MAAPTRDRVEHHPDLIYPDEYYQGIDLFNRGDYFEAHETWECLWLVSSGMEKGFLQGLIQCAVALYHYELGRYGAAKRTLERAFRRLEKVPSPFMSLSIPDFLHQMSIFFDYELSDAQAGRHRPATYPTVQLCETRRE